MAYLILPACGTLSVIYTVKSAVSVHQRAQLPYRGNP